MTESYTGSLNEALTLASQEYSRLASQESCIISKCQSFSIILAGQSVWLLSNLRFNHWLPGIIFVLFVLTVMCDFWAIKNIQRGEINLRDFMTLASMSKKDFGTSLLMKYDQLIDEMRAVLRVRKLCFNLTFAGICATFLLLLIYGMIIL